MRTPAGTRMRDIMGLRRVRPRLAGALALAAATACGDLGVDAQRRELAPYMNTDSMGVVPSDVVRIPLRTRRELVESSAAAASAAQPGIFFTINDSGGEPVLFAFDSTGADRGAWRVSNARNVDWEAASVGPCAEADTGTGATTARPRVAAPRCVYIGDVGDNPRRRATSAIYRVSEPWALSADRALIPQASTGELLAERLTFRYADGPHNVEAMYVSPDTTIYLITKPRLADAAGRPRPALVFRIPAGAWARRDTAVAELADSLPAIVPGSAPLRVVTDAALSPDSRYVAVRTYVQVYVFAADPATGRVRNSGPPGVCNVAGLRERAGEGVGWWGATGKLLLTSEDRRSPLHVVACPLP
jgi:hypothetical protein